MLIIDHTKQDRVFGYDLIRAVAILLVLGSHAFHIIVHQVPHFVAAIFLPDGVDLFFVLSGFLVGSIWIKKIDAENSISLQTFTSFYKRRWFRTVPSYWVVIGLLVIARIIFSGGTFPWEYFLFVQNLFKSEWDPYFFYPEAWSLSVEEWFYLALPLLSIGLVGLRFSKKYALLLLVCIAILAPLLWRIFLFQAQQFDSLDLWSRHVRRIVVCRIDMIAMGVLAAWIKYYHLSFWENLKKNKLICFIALMLIVIFAQPSAYQIPFLSTVYFSSLGLCMALLLPTFEQLSIQNFKLKNVITTISVISYSLYLLNRTPIYQSIFYPFQHYFNQSFSLAVGGYVVFFVVCTIAAFFFYKIVEKPLTALRDSRFLKKV